MKWVKCVYNGGSGDNELTIGKIYKVIIYYPGSVWDERVDIEKDNRVLSNLYLLDTDGRWFEDATAEVRDNKINQILK